MTTTHPSKPVLQRYLSERHKAKTPPPTPEEIRRRLGWYLREDSTRLASLAESVQAPLLAQLEQLVCSTT